MATPMQLFYGGQAVGEAGASQFTWGREPLRNRAGLIHGFTWRCAVGSARIKVNGEADADAKIKAVQEALETPHQNLIFFRSGGVVQSAKSVTSSETVTGVQCVQGPVWSDRAGAQHQTFLEYSATFEWETHLDKPAKWLLEFSERVTKRGGTPHAVVLEPINIAAPQLQITVPKKGYMAVQEGAAVGLSDYPDVPEPIATLGQLIDKDTSETTPERVGLGTRGYAVTWRYVFVSATAPTGSPTLWVDP